MTDHNDDIVAIILTITTGLGTALTFTVFPSPSNLMLKNNRSKAGAHGVWASEFFDLLMQNGTEATLQTNINLVLRCSSSAVGGYNTSNPAGKYCYWINIIPKGAMFYDYNMYNAKLEVEARYLL